MPDVKRTVRRRCGNGDRRLCIAHRLLRRDGSFMRNFPVCRDLSLLWRARLRFCCTSRSGCSLAMGSTPRSGLETMICGAHSASVVDLQDLMPNSGSSAASACPRDARWLQGLGGNQACVAIEDIGAHHLRWPAAPMSGWRFPVQGLFAVRHQQTRSNGAEYPLNRGALPDVGYPRSHQRPSATVTCWTKPVNKAAQQTWRGAARPEMGGHSEHRILGGGRLGLQTRNSTGSGSGGRTARSNWTRQCPGTSSRTGLLKPWWKKSRVRRSSTGSGAVPGGWQAGRQKFDGTDAAPAGRGRPLSPLPRRVLLLVTGAGKVRP